jgi:hypothetical protein
MRIKNYFLSSFVALATLVNCSLFEEDTTTADTSSNRPNSYCRLSSMDLNLCLPPDYETNEYSKNDHSLLLQATFGPDKEQIEFITRTEILGWIDHQLNMGSAYDSTSDNWPTHLERTIEIAKQAEPSVGWYDADDDGTTYFNEANGDIQVTLYQMAAWWDNVLGNPKYPALGQDQLRQRVAYALSQLLVTSNSAFPLNRRGEGLAYYYDLLAKHAFGNYRDLLSDVTRSPTMGAYLSHQGNRKASKSEGIRPDENFAREVM